ncbi:MAG TPA: hypothetical protein VIO11_08795, partial [Candidatus Methanoperedens sp.]
PTDMRTNNFLEQVPSMTKREIKDEIQDLFFSSKSMNLFLESLQEKHNEYPSYFIDLVIDNQVFRKENLNILFSPTVLGYIRPEIIIRICAKHRDTLTSENLQNIYNKYKNNENVVKILFATQVDSYFLIQNSGEKKEEDNKLNTFFIKYQVKKEHFDIILKNIPISSYHAISFISFFSIFIVGFASFIMVVKPRTLNTQTTGTFFALYAMMLFLFAFFFMVLIVNPIWRKVQNYYYNRLINNVIKS